MTTLEALFSFACLFLIPRPLFSEQDIPRSANLIDGMYGNIVNRSNDVPSGFGELFSNMTLLSALLMSLEASKDRPYPKTSMTLLPLCYDYVIVGGGTAGSVMANRLSELPCVRVLLLEAGGNAPYLTEVPSYARAFFESDIDWNYKTIPQEYCAYGQKGRRVNWNAGKVAGGSSVMNAMLVSRGNSRNYDDWVTEGATGWGWWDVLPYFLKLEDNKNINELDKGMHGTGGPMTMEKPNYTPEIKKPILKATAALGYKLTDSNGYRQTGIYDLQGTLRNGKRCSTAKAYLVPAEDRPNLTILKHAFVTKILFRDKRAVGVEFVHGIIKKSACVKREVIISSGSVRAPQLLMLSGIGPRKHLEKFGIKVIADLPVGQNLHDHYTASVNFLVSDSIKNVVKKNIDPINIMQFIKDRSGPLASPTQCTILAFLNGRNTTADSPDFPLQELYFAEYTPEDALKNSNLKSEVYKQVYGKYTMKSMYTCIVSLLQPHSRGEILLNSTNPYDHPLINPNYYKDERDLWDMVEGMKICQAVGTSKEMQEVGSTPLDTLFPGCEKFAGNDTAYFACQAKTVVGSIWHPVGTCRMGHREDPRSVVDPQLRVIGGIQNLRVVCGAIMPIVPSGNTNVPIMMVAEKIADEMKRNLKCFM